MAMSRNEIKEKLFDVIKMAMPSISAIEKDLNEDSNLVSDVGLSSVGILYVVIAIEEFFGVQFNDVSFSDFKTVGDVLNYIEDKSKE